MTGPALLHELLDAAVDRWPEAPAVRCGDEVVTYRQLAADSRAVAGRLAARGVGRGDRVVLALPAGPALPPLLYGCSRVGAAFVVVHEQSPEPAVAHVLDDAEPALLVGADPVHRRLAADRRIAVATPEQAREAAADGPPPAPGPLSVDPVCLIYTSGSTGRPKAVVSTHGQLVFAAAAIQSQLAYRPGDVVFCALPPSFDYGLYQLFLGALSGATVVLAGAADAGPRLLERLHRCGATVLPAVPGMAAGLARLLTRAGARPPRLRLLTNTGAVMPVETLAALRQRIPGLRVQLMFGLTECKRATIMPPDEDRQRPGACGRALPGTEVYAVAPDGRRLPPGEVGEVVVRGPHVMAGYWRRPELTAQRFERQDGLFPRLRTGDHGWLDEDGYLYFLGRRDDLYKERGFRVSGTEVAAAARRLPGVEAAAVLPPAAGGTGATLFVVGPASPGAVLAGLRGELEEFKIPQRCLVLAEIPLTPNGKTDRVALTRLAGPGARV